MDRKVDNRHVIFAIVIVVTSLILTNYTLEDSNEHQVGETGKYSHEADIGDPKCRKESLLRLKNGQEKIRSGNLDEALFLFKEVNNNEPTCLSAIVNIATAYYYLNDFEKSEYMYQEGLRLDPDNEHILASLGVLYGKYTSLEKSVLFHEKALKINNKLPLSHWAVGDAYYELGEYDKAKKHLLVYISMSPNSIYVKDARKRISNIDKK